MNDEEWYKIKSDAEHFLSENQEKYEIIKNFQEQLVNLTNDNFLETIQFIKDHLDVFFKDHGTAISFIHIIMRSLVFNFQKFELILDIVIYFSTEIRNSSESFPTMSYSPKPSSFNLLYSFIKIFSQ